jgi:hypothetical protein
MPLSAKAERLEHDHRVDPRQLTKGDSALTATEANTKRPYSSRAT